MPRYYYYYYYYYYYSCFCCVAFYSIGKALTHNQLSNPENVFALTARQLPAYCFYFSLLLRYDLSLHNYALENTAVIKECVLLSCRCPCQAMKPLGEVWFWPVWGRRPGTVVIILAGARGFSLLQIVQTDPGAHVASCSMDTAVAVSGDKAAGALNSPLTSI
jgi:hypothetical protein